MMKGDMARVVDSSYLSGKTSATMGLERNLTVKVQDGRGLTDEVLSCPFCLCRVAVAAIAIVVILMLLTVD